MKIKETSRGFQKIFFVDANGISCSLQQSSLAEFEVPGTSAIWLGPDENRMHLKLKQVKELLPHLNAWIENGNFDAIQKERDVINSD